MRHVAHVRRRFLPAALVAVPLFAPSVASAQRTVPLRAGMVITESVRIAPGTYRIAANASTDSALIIIRGDGITVDFALARLEGSDVAADPDMAKGVAIRIEGGRDVTLKNATIRGYRFAVLARGTRGLTLEGNDFSHTWKPRLFSQVGHESLVDWMSFHQNDSREWMRFGAAIYLEDVTGGVIRGNRAAQGMNALLMTRTDSVMVRDNVLTHNSALGIGMYRSSDNTIVRNRLDYNVRGYSHGWYRRGQDSAALLMYEQSMRNVVAWNSATHSGDGLFLWAGQHTMDTGQGGANDNYFFHNDFSFAPTNGMEATFSRNRFVANIVEGNDHGLWGGYSYESEVVGNCFSRNRVGIAIEHGQDNTIRANEFRADTTAIYLWANPIEPSDWGYPKFRDTDSRDYAINGNRFVANGTVWRVLQTSGLDTAANQTVSRLEATDEAPTRASASNFSSTDQTACDPRQLLGARYAELAPTVPGVDQSLPASGSPRRERSSIIVDEWGPFDYRSPKLWPTDTMRDAVRLRTVGPAGRWRVVARDGVESISATRGRIGDTLTVIPFGNNQGDWDLTLEYIGLETVSPRGVRSAAGVPVRFGFGRHVPTVDWNVRFFTWTDTLLDPHRGEGNLATILAQQPVLERRESRLDYQWYRPRLAPLPQDRWALEATGMVNLPAGEHSLRTISDDAVRVWIDGRLVIDRTVPGGSEVHYAPITAGAHELRVAFYQLTGWTELRVDIVPGSSRSTGSAGPH